jgi:uncharacterized coiled-coil DUF342 family protein
MIDPILSFLPGYFSDWLGIPISANPRFVINVVACLLLLFLGGYVGRALWAWLSLFHAVRGLNKIREQTPDGQIVTKDALQKAFGARFFASAWNGFRDTLHEQYDYEGGQKRLASIRSTVPAEAIFSPQSLVDARLHVEFFKHLPGILTGIGIIGTFYGLISGIQHFDPSLLAKAKTDPEQMGRLFTGLETLFKEVQGAFIASFFAIGAAMLITFLEKILLNVCYRQLEELCRILDGMYEGGVGEDYLASLVKSSADSATQTKELKQSLVTELSELLRELNTQQIKQSEALGNLLTAKIQEHIDANKDHGEQFRAELKAGLADIGETVARVAGGQGDTVTGMLERLIQTFGDQMKENKTQQDELKSKVKMLIDKITKTTTALNNNITALNDTSINAIKGMNGGARQILSATYRFEQAGNQVSRVMQQAATVSTLLSNSANSLSEASESLEKQLNEYAGTRDALAGMVAEMNEMLERAKQEAGMNQQLVDAMQQTVDEFKKLNNEADKSFDAISKKLAETLAKFREDMAIYDKDLHTRHADTLQLVASAYEPLASSIAGLTDMIAKTRNK